MLIVGGGTICGSPGPGDGNQDSRLFRILRVERHGRDLICGIHDVPVQETLSSESLMAYHLTANTGSSYTIPGCSTKLTRAVEEGFFSLINSREVPKVTFTQQVPDFFVDAIRQIGARDLEEGSSGSVAANYALGMYYLALSASDKGAATRAVELFTKAKQLKDRLTGEERTPGEDSFAQKVLVRLAQAHRQLARHLSAEETHWAFDAVEATLAPLTSKANNGQFTDRDQKVGRFVQGVTLLQYALRLKEADKRQPLLERACDNLEQVYEHHVIPLEGEKWMHQRYAQDRGSLAYYKAKALWCLHCAGGDVDAQRLCCALDGGLAYYRFHLRLLDQDAHGTSDRRVVAIYQHCVSLLILARRVFDPAFKWIPELDSEAVRVLWGRENAQDLANKVFWEERFTHTHDLGRMSVELIKESKESQLGIYCEGEESIGTIL